MGKVKIDTYDIEQRAISVFTSLFTSWIRIEQKPDMEHLDYRVTPRKDNEPTGKMFGVQLKGQKKAKFKNGHLIFSGFSVKHLKYYFDKLSYPVFLFVVDNEKSNCYWIFLQEWLKDNIENKNWRNQSYTSIYLPKENIISNKEDFSIIVDNSIKYMHRLHASSLRVAHDNEIEILRQIDPRFNIKTIITNNNLQHIMRPTSNIKFDLSLKSPNSVNKYIKFNESGNNIQFGSSEVDFPNFPIYQHLKKNSDDLQVIISKKKIKADFYCQYDYLKKNYFLVIPGFIYSGSEQINFQGELTGKLLQMNFNLNFKNNFISISSLNINFEISSYLNKPILNLPYFNDLFAFICCMNNNLNIRTKFLVNGLEIFTSKLANNEIELKIQEVLSLLNKCIEISKYFKVNPTLTSYDEIFNNQEEICLIYNLIKYGRHEIKVFNGKINLPMHLYDTVNTKKLMSQDTKYDFMVISEDTNKSFLGYNLEIGKIVYTYNNWLLETNINSQNLAEQINLELKSNENSRIIASRII